MLKDLTINAKFRKESGKNQIKILRRNNRIPAIVYGKQKKSLLISVDHNEISNNKKEINICKNITLKIDDTQKIKVKIQELQRHPFKSKLIHIDFLRI